MFYNYSSPQNLKLNHAPLCIDKLQSTKEIKGEINKLKTTLICDHHKCIISYHRILFQRFASSTVVAETEYKSDPSQSLFLLGAMSSVKELLLPERMMIRNALNIPVGDVPPSSLISKKAFIANADFMESTFTEGDNVIVNMHGQEFVIKVSTFLSVRCSRQVSSTLFVLGCQYPLQLNEDGSNIQHFWSGFLKVRNQPLENTIFPLNNVKRKVILYNSPDGSLWLVDYQRDMKQLPYQIVVPVFIKEGDMVLIQGERAHDIWYGHVQSVHHLNKTVDVFFFIEHNRCKGIYVRETPGRQALNTVHWDSVVGLANGEWMNDASIGKRYKATQ